MKLPAARTTDLIEQGVGRELLVYDLRINKAYTLNETSKIIFEACDGNTSFDELKRKHKYTDDLIYLALDELKRNNLIEAGYASPFAGIGRRQAIKRVGLATMAALPLIASITAPQAIRAASGNCANGAQPPDCIDMCEEIECPYAQTPCEFDGVCNPATGDCIVTYRPVNTPCDDGDFSTTGEVCDGSGGCAGTCLSGLADCGGTAPRCKDLQSDPLNCGNCGNVCAAGLTCSGGSCVGANP